MQYTIFKVGTPEGKKVNVLTFSVSKESDLGRLVEESDEDIIDIVYKIVNMICETIEEQNGISILEEYVVNFVEKDDRFIFCAVDDIFPDDTKDDVLNSFFGAIYEFVGMHPEMWKDIVIYSNESILDDSRLKDEIADLLSETLSVYKLRTLSELYRIPCRTGYVLEDHHGKLYLVTKNVLDDFLDTATLQENEEMQIIVENIEDLFDIS